MPKGRDIVATRVLDRVTVGVRARHFGCVRARFPASLYRAESGSPNLADESMSIRRHLGGVRVTGRV